MPFRRVRPWRERPPLRDAWYGIGEGGMCTPMPPSPAGSLPTSNPSRKGYEPMKPATLAVIGTALGASAGHALRAPFPGTGGDPVLDLIAYHDPGLHATIRVWYYAAPAIAVVLAGSLCLSVWRVWLQPRARRRGRGRLPAWPTSPNDAAPSLVVGELHHPTVPRIGRKHVSEVATADVLAILKPIWSSKPATARAVHQRIGAVMNWAVAKGYRPNNPAGDAIAAALPRNGNAIRHHKALPHGEVAAALAKVRDSESHAGVRLALEFMVLTATRSNEVRGAACDEVELDVWTIPADRMKAKREHRVPLSGRALEILEEARKLHGGGGIVFRGAKGGRIHASMFSKSLRRR